MDLYKILITVISRLNSYKLEDFDRIKQAVIIPILRNLNWDDTNPEVCWPNYRINDSIYDYALLHSGYPCVLIKCCKINDFETKKQYYIQADDYPESVQLLIITDGNQWNFYLNNQGNITLGNIFYSIFLTNEEKINEYVEFLNQHLSKYPVITGESRKSAEILFSKNYERKKAQELVERVWDSIHEEPDEKLVKLILKNVRNLCGIKPEVEYVRAYLKGKSKKPKQPENEISNKIEISANDISKLFFTRLIRAKFGDLRPAKLNWKNIQILALTSVLDDCQDLDKLRTISRASIVKDSKMDMGYFYIQSHHFSCQNESAPKIAKILERCAKYLGYEVYLEFEWKNDPKASFPGKRGSLSMNYKSKQQWFDKLVDF